MTRKRYSMIIPGGIVIVIASAFMVSALIPNLPAVFFLIYAAAGGGIIILIERLTRKRLDEPVNDERIQGLSEKSLWLTWRVLTPLIIIAGFIMIYAVPGIEELKFIGLGAILTVSLFSVVVGIVSLYIFKKN